MKRMLIVLAIALTGCARDEWTDAIQRYQCTEPQMEKATRETLFCKKESEYAAGYCYSAAIMRNCEPRRAAKEGTEGIVMPNYW